MCIVLNQKSQNINREQYEKDLAERQRRHLEDIKRKSDSNWRPCMHDSCTKCHGTGIDSIGFPCVHMISCPCPKCRPSFM